MNRFTFKYIYKQVKAIVVFRCLGIHEYAPLANELQVFVESDHVCAQFFWQVCPEQSTSDLLPQPPILFSLLMAVPHSLGRQM